MQGGMLVRTIDAGVIAIVTIAVALLGLLGWTVRYMDAHALRTEAEIIRTQFGPEIAEFRAEATLAATDDRAWIARDAQRHAIFPLRPTALAQAGGEPRSRVGALIDDRETAMALDEARNALSQLDPAGKRVDFLLIGPKGDEALALIARVPDASGATSRLAVSMIDYTALASRLERFSIHLNPIFPPAMQSYFADGEIGLSGFSGTSIARISWRSQRVSAVVSTYVFPLLAAILLVGLAVLLVLRRRWNEAREDFKADIRSVESMAFSDVLTGLPNRRALFDHLRKVWPSLDDHAPVTILMLDLDGFKAINDQIGHQAGDRFLIQAARVLGDELGETGFVARLGGDEFVAVVPGEVVGKALDTLHAHLSEALRARTDLSGGLQIGVSIGAATSAAHSGDGEDILRLADIAVHAAKVAGRGRAMSYQPSMMREKSYRRTLERELRAGLMTGEVFLAHQPIVESLTGRVLGYESLVRWRHSVRGLVMPDEFIPIAEQSDLIVAIGDFVLERALTELGPLGDCRISVNVSNRELMAADFVQKITAALQRHTVEPRRLCLEITETSLLEDHERVVEIMAELHEAGVIFAIDDFGVGYSSLSYLLKFKFDVLKIDRAFIASLDDYPEAPTIVTSIVALARSLGMQVTGEGIETRAQQGFLATAGCNSLQGYFFGRPQPLQEMTLVAPHKAATLGPTVQVA